MILYYNNFNIKHTINFIKHFKTIKNSYNFILKISTNDLKQFINKNQYYKILKKHINNIPSIKIIYLNNKINKYINKTIDYINYYNN